MTSIPVHTVRKTLEDFIRRGIANPSPIRHYPGIGRPAVVYSANPEALSVSLDISDKIPEMQFFNFFRGQRDTLLIPWGDRAFRELIAREFSSSALSYAEEIFPEFTLRAMMCITGSEKRRRCLPRFTSGLSLSFSTKDRVDAAAALCRIDVSRTLYLRMTDEKFSAYLLRKSGTTPIPLHDEGHLRGGEERLLRLTGALIKAFHPEEILVSAPFCSPRLESRIYELAGCDIPVYFLGDTHTEDMKRAAIGAICLS